MANKHLPFLTAGLLAASISYASINIDTIDVGDAGNVNDSTGHGGVSYGYQIGKYEVTNSQYAAFLNAKAQTDTHSLYDWNMNSSSFGGITQNGSSGSFTYSVKSGFEIKPVNYVSFWDAARFANWLTNGQGAGDTETGVYDLTAPNAVSNNTVTRDETAWNAGGVAIASENEWYKAAYYDPTLNSGAGGYWDYAHQSDSITSADANYDNSVTTVTNVGTYTSAVSYYGTFDQGGNVQEWNESIASSTNRGLRGGGYASPYFLLQSSTDDFGDPAFGFTNIGFRVSSLAPIPEPSACAAICGLLGLTIARCRRKRGK